MKKNILLVTISFFVAHLSLAQTFVFTGEYNGRYYQRLDSVRVDNLSRSWTETLVCPDTVISFSSSGVCCVDCDEKITLQSYPNPFRGTTSVMLTMPESGDATLRVCDLSGRIVMEKNVFLSSGNNAFDVSIRKKGVHILLVRSGKGIASLKLMNTDRGTVNAIFYKHIGNPVFRRASQKVFQQGDTLRFVGYAIRNGLSLLSDTVLAMPVSNDSYTLTFTDTVVPEGALCGVFSVSPTKAVRFSKGNLQWSATGSGTGSTSHMVAYDSAWGENWSGEGTWRFARHQYDIVGDVNMNKITPYTSGWIDRYGWATSGFHDVRDTQNVFFQPYSYYNDIIEDTINHLVTAGNCLFYFATHASYNCYGFGPSLFMADNDLTGTSAYYDWGIFNAISNGGNMPQLWRTLDTSEWRYIFRYRPNAVYKFALGMIDTIRAGIILLP
ncbi:MAG: T9SS type A sorting domain-containing protein, partial [Bacteroidales bacterium]|nr:T9SS type A sorting domain-containing protein [Bacteroidales bacterium]